MYYEPYLRNLRFLILVLAILGIVSADHTEDTTLFCEIYLYGYHNFTKTNGSCLYEADDFIMDTTKSMLRKSECCLDTDRSYEDLISNSFSDAFCAIRRQAFLNGLVAITEKSRVVEAIPAFLRIKEIKSKKLIVLAVIGIGIEYLIKEIVDRLDMADISSDLYLMLHKYILDKSPELRDRIKSVIEGTEYENIHVDIKNILLYARCSVRLDIIDTMLSVFDIINAQTLGYFISKDIIFTMNRAITKNQGAMKTLLNEHSWEDEEIELVLRDSCYQLLNHINLDSLLDYIARICAVDGDMRRFYLIPAMDIIDKRSSELVPEQTEKLNTIFIPYEIVRFVQVANDLGLYFPEMFKDAPEWFCQPSIFIWLIKTKKLNAALMYEAIWASRSGEVRLLDDEASQHVLLTYRATFIIGGFINTNIIMDIGRLVISEYSKIIRSFEMYDKLLFDVHDVAIVQTACEAGLWPIIERIRREMQPGYMIEDYIMSGHKVMLNTYCYHLCSAGLIDKLQYLMERGVKFGMHHLEYACWLKNLDLIKCVVEHGGIEPNTYCLDLACRSGNMEIVKYLFRQGARPSQHGVNVVCKVGHLEVVQFLCENGMVPDSDGLKWAQQYEKNDVIEYLATGIESLKISSDRII